MTIFNALLKKLENSQPKCFRQRLSLEVNGIT